MAPKDQTPGSPGSPGSPENNDKQLNFGTDDTTLSKQLAQYRAALEQEFKLNDEGTGTTTLTDPSENVERYTRDFFRKNLAQAAAQVVWLSSNATSDSVRLNACKIIIKEALEDARQEGDPLKELLNQLTSTNQ